MYMNHAWKTVVLTTKTAVAVSWSIAFSVGITMKVVYTVGRFQPPTIGHKKLIQAVVDKARARRRTYRRCRKCGLPKKSDAE